MKLLNTALAATLTGRQPGTIRYWASKGWLTRHGTDPLGRALYDLQEVSRVAAEKKTGKRDV